MDSSLNRNSPSPGADNSLPAPSERESQIEYVPSDDSPLPGVNFPPLSEGESQQIEYFSSDDVPVIAPAQIAAAALYEEEEMNQKKAASCKPAIIDEDAPPVSDAHTAVAVSFEETDGKKAAHKPEIIDDAGETGNTAPSSTMPITPPEFAGAAPGSTAQTRTARPSNEPSNIPSRNDHASSTGPPQQRSMRATPNFHEVEATLVPNEPVYDAEVVSLRNNAEEPLSWWKRHRKYILVGTISLIFGAMAATIGVMMSGQSDGNENNDSSTGVRGGVGAESPTLSPTSQTLFVVYPTINGVNSTASPSSTALPRPVILSPSKKPTPSLRPTLSPSKQPKITLSPTLSPSKQPQLSLSPTAPPGPTPPIWNQVGNSFFGDAANDYFGYSTSLSGDGKTLAVGAYGNGYNGYKSGQINIYRRGDDGLSWDQVGDSISGGAGDELGTVSLSEDGKILAIGAEQNGPGYVKVYKLDESSSQFLLLQTITGESGGDKFGYYFALSFDGKTLAVGAYQGGGNRAGYVKVFQMNEGSSNYVQLQTIEGDSGGDEFGAFLDLSSDGNTLAIGSYNSRSGQVKVYILDGSALEYRQRGKSLAGDSPGDHFGSSVSLSSDGLILAVGAEGNDFNGSDSGQVKVYWWDEESSEYRQRGKSFHGAAAGDNLGSYSLSLSSDGKILVTGAFKSDANGYNSGQVKAYTWDESTSEYVQVGQSLTGAPGDELGRSVTLSSDGSTLAVGAQGHGFNGDWSGQVKVFDIEGL